MRPSRPGSGRSSASASSAPDLPGGRLGSALRVDRVEVAPGRQDVSHPARRRARSARRARSGREAARAGGRSRRSSAQGGHDLLGEAQRGTTPASVVAEHLGSRRRRVASGSSARPEGADQRAAGVLQPVDVVGSASTAPGAPAASAGRRPPRRRVARAAPPRRARGRADRARSPARVARAQAGMAAAGQRAARPRAPGRGCAGRRGSGASLISHR